jgi:hypothetical protein
MAAGVFIPLAAFNQRSVDSGLAARALRDAQMLALPSDGLTVTHEFDGERVLGVVVLPSFIVGLDPADFTGLEDTDVRA